MNGRRPRSDDRARAFPLRSTERDCKKRFTSRTGLRASGKPAGRRQLLLPARPAPRSPRLLRSGIRRKCPVVPPAFPWCRFSLPAFSQRCGKVFYTHGSRAAPRPRATRRAPKRDTVSCAHPGAQQSPSKRPNRALGQHEVLRGARLTCRCQFHYLQQANLQACPARAQQAVRISQRPTAKRRPARSPPAREGMCTCCSPLRSP